jgi:multimeric flavodoxin WrbA
VEEKMKVVAFNGSPRKDGNTAILINSVFCELESEGIQTELVQLSGRDIRGCIACYTCYKCIDNKDKRCAVDNDAANECIKKMIEADEIILGSPTYFTDVTAEMKALIDRAGFVSRTNGDLLKNKLGAAVTAVRRAGALHTLDTINHFFFGNEIIVVGQGLAMGREKGEVEKDKEGMRAMKALGQRMARLLKKLNG